MSSNIQISFVIPVFNREKYLTKCLKSILQDTTVKSEVIVVDDCSPGDCLAILKDFPEVKYIRHKENKSSFQARLTGLSLAKGEYICFVDPDDYFQKTDFASLYREISNSNADFGIFSVVTEKSDYTVAKIKESLGNDNIIEDLCKGLFRWNLWDKIFKTETAKKVLSFDMFKSIYMNMAEDFCFFACFCAVSNKAIRLNCRTKYFYNINDDSITNLNTINTQQIKNHLLSYQQARTIALNFLSCNHLSQQIISKLDRKFSWNIAWYYDTYVNEANYSFEELSNIYRWFLDAFNRDDSLIYFIQNHYVRLGEVLQKSTFAKTSTVCNIAIVVSSMGGGGTERVAVCLGELFEELGYSVTYITRYQNAKSFDYENKFRVCTVAGDLTKRIEGFRKIAERDDISTFLFVDYYLYQTMDEILWAKGSGYRVIAMEHNSFYVPFYVNELELFQKRLIAYRAVDALTCLSPMDLLAWQHSGIKNVHFIQNPLPSNLLKNCSLAKKGLIKENRVIFIGRLVYQKGVDLIPQIINQVSNLVPDVVFDIIGSFPDQKSKENFFTELERLSIEKRVRYLGYVSNPETYLEEAKVLFLPSRFEGLPMVLLEAKTLGVPSVVFEMPYLYGCRIEHGCVQVPFGDINAMAKKIAILLTDGELNREYGNRATNSLSLFSDEIIKRKWVELFNSINSVGNDELEKNIDTILMDEFYKSLSDLLPQARPPLQGSIYRNVQATIDKLLPLHSKRRNIVRGIVVRCLSILSRISN